MPTIPLPLTGAATTEAVAVPCSSSSVGVEGLGVQRDRVRPPGELLVREVDAGVDHRHRDARARARSSSLTPMCDGHHSLRRERVGELAEEAARAARVGADRHVGRHGADEPAALEARQQPLRGPARQAPERERGVDQPAAGAAQRGHGRGAADVVELDERARVGLQPREGARARGDRLFRDARARPPAAAEQQQRATTPISAMRRTARDTVAAIVRDDGQSRP